MNQFASYERARRAIAAGHVKVKRQASPMQRALMVGTCLAVMAAPFVLGDGSALALHLPHDGQLYLGAAGAWTFYNKAKKNIGNGSINLGSSTFHMNLYTSASNATTATLSVISSITNELTEANGYSSSGKVLTSVTWTVGASAKSYRFDVGDQFWSAAGGNIANIKYAVLWITGASAGARKALCVSTLSTSQFTLSSGNRLTVQIAATGVFELA